MTVMSDTELMVFSVSFVEAFFCVVVAGDLEAFFFAEAFVGFFVVVLIGIQSFSQSSLWSSSAELNFVVVENSALAVDSGLVIALAPPTTALVSHRRDLR